MHFALIIILTSCTKAPINGDLDGQWEVIEVYPAPSETIIDQRLFYNFYMHVCQLSYYGSYFSDAQMIYEDNTIILDFPYATSIEDIKILKQYGILSNPVTFNVEFLNKNSLILSNDDSVVTLKKH